MSDWYMLDDNDNPVPVHFMTGAVWLDDNPHRKIVKQETLPNGRWVSTVFLGLDHSFGEGPPVLWETMVFTRQGRGDELDQRRYSSLASAKAGHEAVCDEWAAK